MHGSVSLVLALLAAPRERAGEGTFVVHDRCPEARETINGWADGDGCPDKLPDDLAAVLGVIEGLRFHPQRHVVAPGADAVIEPIAAVLRRYPDLWLEVVVHDTTDSDLAYWRADVVKTLLVEHGLEGRRIAGVSEWTMDVARRTPPVELKLLPALDGDGDGVVDALDPCPDEPGDGTFSCPSPDRDGDRIPEPDDRCPDVHERRNGFEDKDGCPDGLPDDLRASLGIVEGIAFERDHRELKPSSFPVLDRAARVLARYPEVRIEISAHGDSNSTVKYGVDPSGRRAWAVKRYLVERGIDERRLETRSAGPDEPIASNKTAAGRARNRRIEFTILVD